jgi:hypothetical protein
MSMIVQDNGGDFERIALGMHRAICINVFDLGLQPGFEGGAPKKKYYILFEAEEREDKSGKRFQVGKAYTQSIGEKSTLGAHLASWRTRPFTAEERKGFDMMAIIGKPCQVNMIAPTKGDRPAIGMVLPADKSRPYWTPETSLDFTPAFVQKMIEEQLHEAPKPQGTQTREAVAADGFTDEIPW